MIVPPIGARAGIAMLDLITTQTRRCWQVLTGPQEYVVAPPPAAQLSPSPSPATSAAVEQLTSIAATDGPVTDHALLVLLGQFAQHLGLVRRLQAVPIAQKTVDHHPQTKLIEFLVAILAGLNQLQELNDAPHPLVRDPAVHAAWGQAAFAHYSGVSRTLAAADDGTLQAVLDALTQISRPFIEREVLAILQTNQPLTLDIDLTGREVSATSTSYGDAAYGWMDDAVAKGYQAAISSLSGGPSGRLLLASQRYDGRAKSADCLQAAVAAVEQHLGLRPQRRTALVQARLDTLTARLAERQQARDQIVARQQLALGKLGGPAAPPRGRQPQPRGRQERQIVRLGERVQALERELWALQQEQIRLRDWLAQLEADNAEMTSVVEVVIRLDAGFATDANLAWLIELGYTVLSKAHSGHTSTRLQRGIATDAVWERVGANAEAQALGPQRIGTGRYVLEALQVRYRLPEGWRYTTLLYYGERPPPPPPAWFAQYNERQTAEAGIKENKAVFTMRRPLVRSRIGMQLQEQFALFAANFMRWAAAWAREQLCSVPVALTQALREVKTLVRVVAHSRARLVQSEAGCALVFDAHSAFAGAVLMIRGQVVYQEVLPLFTVGATTCREVTCAVVAQNLR